MIIPCARSIWCTNTVSVIGQYSCGTVSMPASSGEDGLKLVLVHDLRCSELHVDVVWPEAVRVNAAFVSARKIHQM